MMGKMKIMFQTTNQITIIFPLLLVYSLLTTINHHYMATRWCPKFARRCFFPPRLASSMHSPGCFRVETRGAQDLKLSPYPISFRVKSIMFISGKCLHSYGKLLSLIGKSTINGIAMLIYQRVSFMFFIVVLLFLVKRP